MNKPQQQSPKQRTVRFGAYLPLSLRKALLKAAIDEGVSATRLVERLIRQYLAARRLRAKRRP